MARKKKSSGKNYTSKGERPNVRKDVTKALRREYMADGLLRVLNQQKAWKQGKHVMLTVPNTGNDAKKMPFIRVPATEVWGNSKASYTMKVRTD